MSSTWNILLPGIFGVIGAAIGATVSTAVPWLRESRDQAALATVAALIVQSEIRTNRSRARMLSTNEAMIDAGASLHTALLKLDLLYETDAWEEWRTHLAREVDQAVWRLVDSSYRSLARANINNRAFGVSDEPIRAAQHPISIEHFASDADQLSIVLEKFEEATGLEPSP